VKTSTRIAVAAAVLAALVGLMSWLVPGSWAPVAFADVAEQLNQVHSATWTTTSVVDVQGTPPKRVRFTTDAMFLAPSRERMETTADDDAASTSINIIDGQKNKAIALVPATKMAIVVELKNFRPEDNSFGRTFQGLRELVANAQSGQAGQVERLGPKTIDGRAAEGFRIRLGSIDVTLWADPKTLLPVRVEDSTSAVADGPKVSLVMKDFRFNIPLDESLFAVEVPSGYRVQQTAEIDASKPWAPVTTALKMAAECNDGVFPSTLQGEQGVVSVIQGGAPTLMKRYSGSPEEVLKLSLDVAMSVAGFLGFMNALPPGAVNYAGKDVKLGTPDRPILWITRKKDSRSIVVYADLSVKELSSEDVPKTLESSDGPNP
jgi:outer membrane lipoprotein-sorting protein